MAGRFFATAGAAAVGGAAALKYKDELALAELLRWATAATSKTQPPLVTTAGTASAGAASSVVPQINITASSSDGTGAYLPWRLAAAIGSGALAGVFWAYRSGVTLQDLTWVTQTVFEGAVDELQKAVASTQNAIEKCQMELGMQIDELEQEVQDTRDQLEHTVKTEVGYNRNAIHEVHQQLEETDATVREMQRQVATRKQLEELRTLVERMKSTGDSTYEELRQLHADIRALAGALIQQHTDGIRPGSSKSLTMGQLGTKLSEALALAERQVGLPVSESNELVSVVDTTQQNHENGDVGMEKEKDRPFTPPTDPTRSRAPSRSGLLRTARNF